MKILVDEAPKSPKDCLFAKWNCEYGWVCRIVGAKCDAERKDNDPPRCEKLAVLLVEEPPKYDCD